MRVTVGAVAVLGLAVTVAAAQPVKERAAALKAPQALAPNELPVARGAADDFPPSTSGTPVARTSGSAGPAWLTGADPNVVPAAGTGTKSNAVRALGLPSALAKDETAPPKMLDRLKIFPGDKQPVQAPQTVAPQPVSAQPAAAPPAPQPTASTPFRGTGANGAPVYAGPPAYRWYGWGSVTPGANPLAPAGQYPKASANWYSITGATPGAFPVPVTNGARIAPGTEPPTYGLAPRTQAPAPVVTIASPPPAPTYVDRAEPEKFSPRPESKFTTGPAPSVGALPPSFGPPAVPVPALTPPPIPKPATAVAPSVLPPPAVPLPPAPVVVAPSLPPAPVVAPKAEPVAALAPSSAPLPPTVPAPAPVVAPAVPVPSVTPAAPVALAPSVEPAKPAPLPIEPKPVGPAPAALPTSVTADPPRDDPKWNQSPEPAAPRPGTWAPATGAAPLPTVPFEGPGVRTGRAPGAPIVARGQFNDNTPDPVTVLIKQMCQGRATDIEVRHTGTKKIQVCFEVRGTDAAQKLVADISKRPELTAYQIDFCVLVK